MKKIIILAGFIFVALALSVLLKWGKKSSTGLDFREQDAIAWSAKWQENGQEKGQDSTSGENSSGGKSSNNGKKSHFISVQKKDDAWYITNPTNTKADRGECEANVKNFLSIKAIETFGTLDQIKNDKVEIDPSALDISASNEVFTIDYIKNKETNQFSIKVIKKHDVLQAYFVFFDEKIHLVQDWYVLALRKSLDDVIEKDFLKIEPRKIIRIEAKDYVLLKKGLYYDLLENDKKTSVEKIDQLVQNLGFLAAERAVIDPSEQKSIANPKNVLQRFSIDLNDRRKIKLIIFYTDQKEKSGIYAKIDDEKSPLIYEIDSKNLASFSMKKRDFLLN